MAVVARRQPLRSSEYYLQEQLAATTIIIYTYRFLLLTTLNLPPAPSPLPSPLMMMMMMIRSSKTEAAAAAAARSATTAISTRVFLLLLAFNVTFSSFGNCWVYRQLHARRPEALAGVPGRTTSTAASLSYQQQQQDALSSTDAVNPVIPEDEWDIVASAGDSTSLESAARFMVENFWLGSPRQSMDPAAKHQRGGKEAGGGTMPGANSMIESDHDTTLLVEDQFHDFVNRYGERVGRRLLDSVLLAAKDREGQDIVGIVGLEACLLDKKNNGDIVSVDDSETILKNAVAGLRPKERREYNSKDISAIDIASNLLPPDEYEIACCLSNLAVASQVRGRGVATALCRQMEEIAKEWGFSRIYLKVESENTAARNLYETRLGYECVNMLPNAPAIRADVQNGCFVEIQCETLVLVKKIAQDS